jgi:hypothetical protein
MVPMTSSDDAGGPEGPEERHEPAGAEDSAPSEADAEADDTTPDEAVVEFPPEGFERWRRRSALGSVGTGIALGLQNVFAPPADQVVMVAPIPGGPPDPDRLQVILDPDDPTKSIVVMPPAKDDASPERSEPDDQGDDPPA